MKIGNLRNELFKRLAEEGEKLIEKAFDSSDYRKDKTQNLHDSYGSAVFYNGSLVRGTERYLNPMAKVAKYNYYTNGMEKGRDEIRKFFKSYKPKSNGIELVVAVAMFYGEFLEKKKGGIKRKYVVISGISEEIEQLAKKYRGSVRNINL